MIKDLLDRLCQLMPDRFIRDGNDYQLLDGQGMHFYIPSDPTKFGDDLARLQHALQDAIAIRKALYRVENASNGIVYASILGQNGTSLSQASDEQAAIALLKATVAWLEAEAQIAEGKS